MNRINKLSSRDDTSLNIRKLVRSPGSCAAETVRFPGTTGARYQLDANTRPSGRKCLWMMRWVWANTRKMLPRPCSRLRCCRFDGAVSASFVPFLRWISARRVLFCPSSKFPTASPQRPTHRSSLNIYPADKNVSLLSLYSCLLMKQTLIKLLSYQK